MFPGKFQSRNYFKHKVNTLSHPFVSERLTNETDFIPIKSRFLNLRLIILAKQEAPNRVVCQNAKNADIDGIIHFMYNVLSNR